MADVTVQHPDLAEPIIVQPVEGSDRPARIYLAPTLDGLYTPYALRTPADEGSFPFVFLAYGLVPSRLDADRLDHARAIGADPLRADRS